MPTPENHIPDKRVIQGRIKRWLIYAVSRPNSSKKDVATATGLSQAHVSNLCNHDWARPNLETLIGMHYGLGLSLRELFYDEPPDVADGESPTQSNGLARKSARTARS